MTQRQARAEESVASLSYSWHRILFVITTWSEKCDHVYSGPDQHLIIAGVEQGLGPLQPLLVLGGVGAARHARHPRLRLPQQLGHLPPVGSSGVLSNISQCFTCSPLTEAPQAGQCQGIE